jgi:SAM-dependent methyltransferase
MTQRSATDTWESGDPYELYVGRWSRRVAPRFLEWLDAPAGRRWLDVGCGTGALCAAIVDHAAPASVTAVDPSEGFLATASGRLGHRVVVTRGSAADLPLETGSVDVTVSGLVLNFAPDVPAALAEMTRVTTGGGTISAYVWDYAAGMDLMRLFWDTAAEHDSAATALDEGVRFPLCRPETLAAAFDAAGLGGVNVIAIDIATPFTDFDDYWRPFLGGQGPAPSYVASLDDEARDDLRERLRRRVPTRADGSIELTARAWAVRGRVEG